MNTSNNIIDTIASQKGKRVTVYLRGGTIFSGNVAAVATGLDSLFMDKLSNSEEGSSAQILLSEIITVIVGR